ncbi:arsenic resistance protein [uncultured Pseudokineococcus sp.]|uniref:arsenic resistance protein n=1 Tax=uncultured Pseudokineococcus sp. TaxID=1642928 RepID=UPI002604BB16|nr:bile acid:sodium symporter [uncultured Pseudokineococcus sp.]
MAGTTDTAEDGAGQGLVAWADRHQIALYVLAIAAGVAIGLGVPGSPGLEVAINPVLATLLYATFLGIPFAALGRAARDGRFMAAVLVLNFVLVPGVAYGLSRFVADDPALLFGVLLVLLTPCIDYVIVFSGLAGAASERLLAASPLLMLAQFLLLPVYLFLFIGPEGLGVVEPAPFVEAFLVLIVAPLTAAAATQALARRHRAGARLQELMHALMVPLMMATLAVVVASQAQLASGAAGQLARVVPVFAGFLLVMALVGSLTGRVFGLDVPTRRALVFSGATRNGLVILPLALAVPASLSLAPAIAITQTLVELIGMIVYVRLVPALVPHPRPTRTPPS